MSLKGTLPWQRAKVKKSAFFGPIYFLVLPFRNGLLYRNFDFERLDRMNFSTLYTILLTFGPETPEFMLLNIAPFLTIQQKSAYHVKYLRISWAYLDLRYRYGRRITGVDFPNIRLAVAPTCWWRWLSGRTSVFGRRSFPVLRPTCS